jgi:predicted nucleic acid-binding protein
VPRRRSGASVLVDSGAWIALLSARDQHHLEAEELFQRAAREGVPLLTTNLILAEIHRFVLFRAGIRAASAALGHIESSALVQIEFATAGHHRAALEWLGRFADQRFTYTDAVSFAVMRSARCRAVLGFDRDFAIAGFSFWGDGR